MKLEKIVYAELNSKQKEVFNFQKIASELAEYGFNCIKLADDWQGADFLAYHKDGDETLKVQLKARLTIDKKYMGQQLYMAFPAGGSWCLIEHDRLVEIVREVTGWLASDSWKSKGNYHAAKPNAKLMKRLQDYIL